MIAASSQRHQLGTAFGVHRAMDTAGAMLGPLLAVGILSVAPQAYDAIFVVSLCVALIGLAVIVLFIDNPSDKAVVSLGDTAAIESPANQGAVSLQSMASFEPTVPGANFASETKFRGEATKLELTVESCTTSASTDTVSDTLPNPSSKLTSVTLPALTGKPATRVVRNPCENASRS